MNHEPKLCSVPNCPNEATRWYEDPGQPEGTFYTCLEHPRIARAERMATRVRNSAGHLVELPVYECSPGCEHCA